MKFLKFITCILVLNVGYLGFGQNITSNINPVGLEHNLLFHANSSSTPITVTQTGSGALDLNRLFDGKFEPSYSSSSPSESNPLVLLIENLPEVHTQRGSWFGWSTRYWQPKKFLVEGYDTHLNANVWRVIADYSTNAYEGGTDFNVKNPPGVYTKLRMTIYTAKGTNGELGLSEVFFLHPEAVSPYETLISSLSSNIWNISGDDINYTQGSVGIGTSTPDSKLSVNGIIHTKEVKVDLTGWSDFVFEEHYDLPKLEDVEKHIQEQGHLKDIPSAKEVESNGILLGEMDAKLLQKIEELMLYTINQEKRMELQNKQIKALMLKVEALETSK